LDEEQSARMADLIRAKYGEEAKLLVVNHTHNFCMKVLPAEHPNLYRVKVYDENENTGQDWRGYNPHWNRLLANIRLQTVKVDFRNDAYFERFHACENRMGMGRNQFRWSTGDSILHLEEYGGCRCRLFLSTPRPMNVEILDVYGAVMSRITISGNAVYTFEVTHSTRFIEIKSDSWQPIKLFGTQDIRELGVCLEGIEMEWLS